MGAGRRPNSIRTQGYDIPAPISSFKQLFERYSIAKPLQTALTKSGYKAPTAVQSQVIPLMIDRREIVCSAPTGSGKTLAFTLPIIHQLKQPKKGSFRALILTPTRELAKQIHREALWIAQGTLLRIHIITDQKEAAKKFNAESQYKFDVLITTPNKLAELLKTKPPSVSLSKLEWLILDECDRLFDVSFKDDFKIIYKHCLQSDTCRRAMFSATYDSNLVKWAEVQMNNLAIVIVGGKNKTSSNVEQELVYVGNEDGKVLALRDLIHFGIEVPALIFVETKEKAKLLATEFLYDDLNMDFIHSEREQQDRDKIVAAFREGKIWFLVCTDLMGRGIDFKGVNVVVNYDCPKTPVSYIHRIGRTGRANRSGHAITFVANEDRSHLEPILKLLRLSGCEIPKQIETMMASKKKKKKVRERDIVMKKGKKEPKVQNASAKEHSPLMRSRLQSTVPKHTKKLKTWKTHAKAVQKNGKPMLTNVMTAAAKLKAKVKKSNPNNKYGYDSV